ncbi:MAG: AAA family ATPase, partial [Bacteroidia bacterium]
MTREIVLGLLSNKLQDVSFIPDTNILFGKYSYNQLTLGTYFIDYNESSLDFDLREYQEKYISSEYYKIPGYTQWNYYLIFIRTSYQEEQKIHIEKDDIYTRKFVFTPDELKKYFEYQKSDKAVDADIINVWKEKLKAVDLDEVYSEAPYTKAIPRYLANEVIKDIEVEQLTTKSNQKLTINKISHLKLKDDYRKYPVLKGFTLGKVNLIKGVNGSGKTSFLESIELIVAGKTIRNPSSPEKNNCIEATYNDGVLKDEYTPGDNSKYRERDIAWYASAAKSGNELFRSFNRYNFYDSDAAYNLSYNSNVGSSLSKYLSSIALGPEFSRIQNRLEGFNERLAKENNDRKKIIKEETTRSDNAKKTLESIQSASNPKEYFDSFMAFAKEIKWNKELPKKFDDSYSLFEENYQTTQSYINSLNQLLITIKLRNLKSWKEDLIKIEKALQDCNKSKVQIKEVNIIIKENDILLNNLDTQFRILESAKKFFEDQSSFNLWNLNERINLLSIEIKKSKRIIEQVERISDQSFLQNNIIFDIYKNKKTAAQQDLSNKQKQIKGQIENLKSNLNKLQGIVSEIKSHGKQYISLNENADACPLCETPYSYDELSDRISKIAQDLKENVAIDQLNNQLIKIDADLLNLEADIKNIQLLEIAISNSYSETDYAQFSLIQISDHINTIRTKVNVDEAEYLKLSQLKQDFADKGLFEENFNTIKESLEDNFENIKFVFTDKSLFEEMYNKIKKQSFDLTLLTKTAKDHLLDLENTLKKIIQEVAPSVNYLEYDA